MHSYNTRFKSKNNSFNKPAVNNSSKKTYPPKKVYTREELLSFTIALPTRAGKQQTIATVANNPPIYPPKKTWTREELLSFTVPFPNRVGNPQTTTITNNDKLPISDTAARQFEHIKQLTKAVEECKKQGMTEEMLSNAINLMTYLLYNHHCVKERSKFKMILLNKCDEFMQTADKNTDQSSKLFTSDVSKFWVHYGLYRHLRRVCNDLKTKLLSL
jgi:hypothetical protein